MVLFWLSRRDSNPRLQTQFVHRSKPLSYVTTTNKNFFFFLRKLFAGERFEPTTHEMPGHSTLTYDHAPLLFFKIFFFYELLFSGQQQHPAHIFFLAYFFLSCLAHIFLLFLFLRHQWDLNPRGRTH